MLSRQLLSVALLSPVLFISPILFMILGSITHFCKILLYKRKVNAYLFFGLIINVFYVLSVFVITGDFSRAIFACFTFLMLLGVNSFNRKALKQYLLFCVLILSLDFAVDELHRLIVSPIVICLILLLEAKLATKILVNYTALISLFSFNRRYMTLVIFVYSCIQSRLQKSPFLMGALVSILFPVASLFIAPLVEDAGSLYSRVRQILFMWDTFRHDYLIIFVGSNLVGLEYPAFFWPGDTKMFGTIFEFGILLWLLNVTLLMLTSWKTPSKEVKFLMGFIAFGYLAATPISLAVIILMAK